MIEALKSALATKFVLPMLAAALLIAGAGGYALGRYSAAVTVAHAQVTVAKCGEARSGDNAAANAAGAKGLSVSVAGAAKADHNTGQRGAVRAQGYEKAKEEANHADTPQTAKPCPPGAQPGALLHLFDGMRDADRAADRAGRADRDGLP